MNLFKASRQISQLEDIKHDLQQILQECDDLLSVGPNSKKVKEARGKAREIENLRFAKSRELKERLEKWENEASLLAEIDSWAEKREDLLESLVITENDSSENFVFASPSSFHLYENRPELKKTIVFKSYFLENSKHFIIFTKKRLVFLVFSFFNFNTSFQRNSNGGLK